MRTNHQHPWNVTPKEARAIQERLRGEVASQDRYDPVERVMGVDVGFEDGGARTRAAVVVLELRSLRPLEQAFASVPTTFPYVPGLLSFREIPAILEAYAKLRDPPQLVVCDGQGIAHPRRFGLASHLGLLLDLPTIGVAKTRLLGEHGEVPDHRGAWVPLRHDGETIGAVVRTRIGVKPVYVSIGHRVSLPSAVAFTLACAPKYRLPETTRLADRLASTRKGG